MNYIRPRLNPACNYLLTELETESIEKLNTSEQENLSQDQKHTSAVAKIHYQKRKSEDMVTKAKKIIDKLRDKNESSLVINLINSDTEM